MAGRVLIPLLLLSIAAVARTQQYFDILQGIQQLFQPYQQNRVQYPSYDDVTRRTTDRHNNRQENRKTKKPPTNQFEYIFATTTKPSRKTTKSSSQSKVVSNSRNSNKNRNTNTDFNYEATTKSSRNKETTRGYNNKATTANNRKYSVTENIVMSNRGTMNNKPVIENFEIKKSEKYESENPYDFNANRGNNNDNSNRPNNRPNTEFYPSTSSNRGTSRVTDTNQNTNKDFNRGSNNNGAINNNNNGINRPESGNRNVNVANFNNDRRNTESNYDRYNNYDRTTNWGLVETKKVVQNNFGFTTQNPLLSRPGVRPLPVDDGRPPITNRPVTQDNFYPNSGNVPVTESPDLLIGPDEDDMTSLQKRRYIDLAEKMCDRYKALNVRKLVALPLVPSPSPVEFNVTSCTPISVPLVIGGTIVDIKEFPHMALVGWMKIRVAGYSWKCGGSLISDKYVLTAGHCTYQDKDYEVESGPPQAVQLGSSFLDDRAALVVRIASVYRHPKYKTRRSYHDVALIKMVKRVTFSDVIKPACLGTAPPAGNNIVATGWGRTEFGGDHSLELRSVPLPIWDMQDCRRVWGTSLKLPNGPTPDSHICAGDKRGGKDTCQGDSGGPAQIQDGCVWRVVAVTSYGRSCGAPQTPALYAVVPKAFVAAQVFGEEVDYGGRGDATSNRRDENYYRNR